MHGWAGMGPSCPTAMGGEEGGKEKHRHGSNSLIRAGNAGSPQTALFPWQREDASKRTKFGTLPQMSWDFVVVSQLDIIIPYFFVAIISCLNRFQDFLRASRRSIFTSLVRKKTQMRGSQKRGGRNKASSWETNVSMALIPPDAAPVVSVYKR